MTNIVLSLMVSTRVTSFILSVLIMVCTVGAILLLANFINKRITKKEEEQKEQENNEDNK